MAIKPFTDSTTRHKQLLNRAVLMAVAAAIMLPGLAFADGDTETNICGVLNTINNLLNVASVIVVTIAIIFSGYQIAFAHKRISDVAPALIGGVLIGAAAQIAKMVIGGDNSGQCAAKSLNSAMLMDQLHAVVQSVQHYA